MKRRVKSMSTDRQKSFTARLTGEGAPVCFQELYYEEEKIDHIKTGRGYAALKDSKYLCINNKITTGALLYFRFRAGNYAIFSREQKEQYGKPIETSNGYLLAGTSEMQFTLLDAGKNRILTLDDIPTNATSFDSYIQGPYQTLEFYEKKNIDHSLWFSYLVTHGGTNSLKFTFNIEERNVGWVAHPEEV